MTTLDLAGGSGGGAGTGPGGGAGTGPTPSAPPKPTPTKTDIYAVAESLGFGDLQTPARPGPVETGSWKAGGPASFTLPPTPALRSFDDDSPERLFPGAPSATTPGDGGEPPTIPRPIPPKCCGGKLLHDGVPAGCGVLFPHRPHALDRVPVLSRTP